MANLAEALDAALRARYMPREIKSPVTTRRGFNARLNALGTIYPTQKKLAAALGIDARTIRRWNAGGKISASSLRKVEGLHNRLITLPKTRANLKAKTVPNSVKVTAVINWNGYRNRAKNGHRTTTLGGMQGVMTRVIRIWASAGPDAAADAFERGVAERENLPNSEDEPGFQAEGDDVNISFPWSD